MGSRPTTPVWGNETGPIYSDDRFGAWTPSRPARWTATWNSRRVGYGSGASVTLAPAKLSAIAFSFESVTIAPLTVMRMNALWW